MNAGTPGITVTAAGHVIIDKEYRGSASTLVLDGLAKPRQRNAWLQRSNVLKRN